jgi:hypothetical protein
MFNGTGVPAIVYKGEIIELPHPKADGRESNYEPLNEPYENLDGELVPPDPREWRYVAEYDFARLTTSVINKLTEIYNKTSAVKFVPHIDVPQIAYIVLLDEAKPSDQVYKDGFKLKMKSKKPVKKIPTIDNMISCFQFNHVIVFNGG